MNQKRGNSEMMGLHKWQSGGKHAPRRVFLIKGFPQTLTIIHSNHHNLSNGKKETLRLEIPFYGLLYVLQIFTSKSHLFYDKPKMLLISFFHKELDSKGDVCNHLVKRDKFYIKRLSIPRTPSDLGKQRNSQLSQRFVRP